MVTCRPRDDALSDPLPAGPRRAALVVARDGTLRRHDTIHAHDLPVPAGNHWGFVAGRYVPVG